MTEKSNVTQINATESPEDKYKREQKARMAAHKVGELDSSGCVITKIYARGDNHIIYEIKENSCSESFRVLIDTEIENDETPLNNFQEIKDELDKLKAVLYQAKLDHSYKQRAASAVVTAIRGDIDRCNSLLNNIKNDAIAEHKKKVYARIFYLGGAMLPMLLFCLFSIIAYIGRNHLLLESNPELAPIIYAVTFSCLGGFFSVSLKAKEVYTQQAIGYWMYGLYGSERLVISMIAGIIAYTLVSSGVIFSAIQGDAKNIFPVLVLCFASGFSETLIPNYMNKLDSTIKVTS
ncbi:hypothetical protein [Plesiomonas shigelloides]|uniref:hypothetical protein n=1 Tax=Plesiomonas shigelloides TaxID=703 RepID=UPI001261446B|nr:hypothetical protein [Plesiomonas shigelloides]KAB7693168.1 hypothetical protein GBN20_00830 [Plesiomonas shigelloides]